MLKFADKSDIYKPVSSVTHIMITQEQLKETFERKLALRRYL